ncbi:MAG: hypothetical protein AB2A00_41410 [Myxococcota bacterium]
MLGTHAAPLLDDDDELLEEDVDPAPLLVATDVALLVDAALLDVDPDAPEVAALLEAEVPVADEDVAAAADVAPDELLPPVVAADAVELLPDVTLAALLEDVVAVPDVEPEDETDEAAEDVLFVPDVPLTPDDDAELELEVDPDELLDGPTTPDDEAPGVPLLEEEPLPPGLLQAIHKATHVMAGTESWVRITPPPFQSGASARRPEPGATQPQTTGAQS